MVFPDLSEGFYKSILRDKEPVTVGDAIFRKETNFVPANLKNHSSFWEQEILKDHPHKKTLLKWINGIHIEEFLNSFTTGNNIRVLNSTHFILRSRNFRIMFHLSLSNLWMILLLSG